MEEAVNPVRTLQDWLYYREFGEQYKNIPALTPDDERLVTKLRHLQKELFSQEVQIVDLPDRLDNPPLSLKQILQQRLDSVPLTNTKPVHTRADDTHQAIKRGIIAAAVVLLVYGLVFLIKSTS